VILSKEEQAMYAVRNPKELNTENMFQVRLAEGQVEVEFSKVEFPK
jgi:exodeoxyribonuclease VII large subunit